MLLNDETRTIVGDDENNDVNETRVSYEWLARDRDPSKLRKQHDLVSEPVSYQEKLKSMQKEKKEKSDTNDEVDGEKTNKFLSERVIRLKSRNERRPAGQPLTYSQRLREINTSFEANSNNNNGYKSRWKLKIWELIKLWNVLNKFFK